MIIIDVRTKKEYDEGHIDGAIHHGVVEMMGGVFPDIEKDKEVVLYCQFGNRSGRAKELMENAGFGNVTNGGGMDKLAKELR